MGGRAERRAEADGGGWCISCVSSTPGSSSQGRWLGARSGSSEGRGPGQTWALSLQREADDGESAWDALPAAPDRPQLSWASPPSLLGQLQEPLPSAPLERERPGEPRLLSAPPSKS